MAVPQPSCPLTRRQVVHHYFLEHRAKVLDIAAYLDRLERAAGDADDFREQALSDALRILTDGKSDRAKRVLETLSDPTTSPIDTAPGKGAAGAYFKPQSPAP